MIQFNALAKERPNNLPEEGYYIAKIEKAEMKQGQDVSKPMYLNLMYALKTKDGVNVGKMYDIITQPLAPFTEYKLARFIDAIGYAEKMPAQFELSDLVKIVKDRELIIKVTPDKKQETPTRIVVDITNDIYYPVSEADTLFNSKENANGLSIFEDDADDAKAPEPAQPSVEEVPPFNVEPVHNSTETDPDDIF